MSELDSLEKAVEHDVGFIERLFGVTSDGKCKKCGEEVDKDDEYCSNCGASLT